MIDPRMWKVMQKRLGYDDSELELFRNNPRNEQVLSKLEQLQRTRFVVEVVDAHGCNSRHKKGDTFQIDGHGNLVTAAGPGRICLYALGSLTTLLHAAQELIYAGVDPNEMRFKSAGCRDIGLNCGGWGKIVMTLSAVRTEAED